MLRFGRSSVMAFSHSSGLVVTESFETPFQRCRLRVYTTQSHCQSEQRGSNPLGLAVVGAAAMSASLERPMEGVAQTCAGSESRLHKWQLFDEIGSGAFGTVCLGMHQETGEVAAVKIVPFENPEQRRSYQREIAALRLVKALGGHCSIIDLRDVYVQGRRLFLVTELARGGELFEQVVAYGSFSEVKAQEVTRELASALSFLHRHGLVHKDIKPENVLLSTRVDDDTSRGNYRRHKTMSLVKLADFGSAGPAGVVTRFEDIGTTAYLPPELFTRRVCTSACDMWALGCVLYIMLCGSHPFDLDGMSSDHVVEHRIRTEPVTFAFSAWDNVSPDAKDMIYKLLEKDPEVRLTADEMLQHPWVNGQGATAITAVSLCRPVPLLAGQPIPMNPA